MKACAIKLSAFLRLTSPAWARPVAGVCSMTKVVAKSIQAVSPVSMSQTAPDTALLLLPIMPSIETGGTIDCDSAALSAGLSSLLTGQPTTAAAGLGFLPTRYPYALRA